MELNSLKNDQMVAEEVRHVLQGKFDVEAEEYVRKIDKQVKAGGAQHGLGELYNEPVRKQMSKFRRLEGGTDDCHRRLPEEADAGSSGGKETRDQMGWAIGSRTKSSGPRHVLHGLDHTRARDERGEAQNDEVVHDVGNVVFDFLGWILSTTYARDRWQRPQPDVTTTDGLPSIAKLVDKS